MVDAAPRYDHLGCTTVRWAEQLAPSDATSPLSLRNAQYRRRHSYVTNPARARAVAEVEARLHAVSTCAFDPKRIAPSCTALRALPEAAHKHRSPLLYDVGVRNLTHFSPAVRAVAAEWTVKHYGEESPRHEIPEAFLEDDHPLVVRTLYDALSDRRNRVGQAPGGRFHRVLCRHRSSVVRSRCRPQPRRHMDPDLVAIGLSPPYDVDHALELCGLLPPLAGHGPVERALDDLLVTELEARRFALVHSPTLHNKCFRAVIKLWLHAPGYGTADRSAYELTLKHLRRFPRASVNVADSLQPLLLLNHHGPAFAAWRVRASWVDAGDVIAALEAVARAARLPVAVRETADLALADWRAAFGR